MRWTRHIEGAFCIVTSSQQYFFVATRQAKILDFGLAKLERATAIRESAHQENGEREHRGVAPASSRIGDRHIAYMSPEQAEGRTAGWSQRCLFHGAWFYYELATDNTPSSVRPPQ